MGLLLHNHAHSFQMEAVTFCYILHEFFFSCMRGTGWYLVFTIYEKQISYMIKELAIDNILIVS